MKRYPVEQPSTIDLVDLLEQAKVTLQREITNLRDRSSQGKLKTREADNLVRYTKLLAQLVKEEEKRANEAKPEST
jgi:hypothetical protein